VSEVAIWQPGELDRAPAVPNGQLDDWIMVADKVVKLAEVIANSPFVPVGLRGSVPATAAAILTGRELGVPPMTALANIYVIGGKPGLSALVMRALIQSKGHDWQDVHVSDTRVVVRGRRKGESEWTEAGFTAEQARVAGIKMNGYPQDKLYARATARLARRKFADVIAGMPYSAEELEDGFDDDTPASIAAEQTAAEQPKADKPRTAQRKQRAPKDTSPADAAPVAVPAPPPAQPAGEALPPLPGEEETSPGTAAAAGPQPGPAAAPDDTDYDTAGTVSPQQLTAIWTVLSKAFAFGAEEKEQARVVCAHVVEHDLDSSKDLSRNEAKAVLDTLAHWQHQAKERGETPRDYLIAAMVATDTQGDTDAQ
jgi:hypothetical protein